MGLYCIHGFLGLPTDWDFLRQPNNLPAETETHFVPCWDYLQKSPLSLEDWAREFTQKVAQDDSGPHILLGYSMGGRLALHALLQAPSLWAHTLIVSAHPGLDNKEARHLRLANDQRWVERFLNQPWDELLAAWNAQSVFQQDSSQLLPRREGDFSRTALARSLDCWSLGRQEDLLPQLKKYNERLTWLVGEHDQKFVDLTQTDAFFNSGILTHCLKNTGHRLPWQDPHSLLSFLLPHL